MTKITERRTKRANDIDKYNETKITLFKAQIREKRTQDTRT